MGGLADSGQRTEYAGGALRETGVRKGRCDLLPLVECAYILSSEDKDYKYIILQINNYIFKGDPRSLRNAILRFIDIAYAGNVYNAFVELGKHYEDGADKYGERNWEKGLPLHTFIDSGIRHLFKYAQGLKDEPHERAFLWNMIGALWVHRNRPDLADLPFAHKE